MTTRNGWRPTSARASWGSYVLGMGFTFDDTDRKGVATPLAEMERLIEENPRNRDVIFPYIGGEEINTSPTHAHHRYVINFRDWPLRRGDFGGSWRDASEHERREWRRDGTVPHDYPEPVAADWPGPLSIVEEKVKPQRDDLPPKNSINREARDRWWRFLAYRQGLTSAISGLERVLGISRISVTTRPFLFLVCDLGLCLLRGVDQVVGVSGECDLDGDERVVALSGGGLQVA